MPRASVDTSRTIAQVTDIEGSATVVDGDKRIPVSILFYVDANISLELDKNSRIAVTYLTAHTLYTLITGQKAGRVRIGEDRPKGEPGVTIQSRELDLGPALGAILEERANFESAGIVLRGDHGRSDNRVKLVFPTQTAIIEKRPVFRWSAIAPKAKYRFVLEDEDGREIVNRVIDANFFALPGRISMSEEIDYFWRVEATLPTGETHTSKLGAFSILASHKRKLLTKHRPAERAPFSERVLYAEYLELLHLHHDARVLWEQLTAERPEDPGISARLRLE